MQFIIKKMGKVYPEFQQKCVPLSGPQRKKGITKGK
jgi:hypothetical protein